MNTETKYFLRHKETKLPATYDTESNADGDFCVSVQHTLGKPYEGDPVWYADTKEGAELARVTHTGWYNADMATPSHSSCFKSDDYEVVKRVFTYTDELA